MLISILEKQIKSIVFYCNETDIWDVEESTGSSGKRTQYDCIQIVENHKCTSTIADGA